MAKKRKKRKKRSPRTEAIDSVVGRQKKINGIELYQVESALETMTRAEEIQKDERLMKATEKLLKRRQDALSKVSQSIRSKK